MIKELYIENFRSIREATLELGRFTVLTGANNSGKSSVLYALQVLKNVVTNPNRSVDELLNLGFLNLGGLDGTKFMNNLSKGLELLVNVEKEVSFISEGKKMKHLYKSGFGVRVLNKYLSLIACGKTPIEYNHGFGVSFPYPLNEEFLIPLTNFEGWKIRWDGIRFKALLDFNAQEIDENRALYHDAKNQISIPIQELTVTEVIPTSRGFTKPIFNTTPLNGHIYTEDEVATLIATDKEVQAKVALYFEKITGKRFSISIQPGMGFFYMQVREADGSFSTELVNQGMGMNQIVFLLAKILYGKNRLICIDEPEIHLHPALIEQFVRVLVEIAEKEDKQFIFSTHSEHWLLSLLAEVNDGKLAADDLKVYYLQKEDQETTVEQQQVMPNGQLEGGLKNFMESQMRLAERFFDTTTA